MKRSGYFKLERMSKFRLGVWSLVGLGRAVGNICINTEVQNHNVCSCENKCEPKQNRRFCWFFCLSFYHKIPMQARQNNLNVDFLLQMIFIMIFRLFLRAGVLANTSQNTSRLYCIDQNEFVHFLKLPQPSQLLLFCVFICSGGSNGQTAWASAHISDGTFHMFS